MDLGRLQLKITIYTLALVMSPLCVTSNFTRSPWRCPELPRFELLMAQDPPRRAAFPDIPPACPTLRQPRVCPAYTDSTTASQTAFPSKGGQGVPISTTTTTTLEEQPGEEGIPCCPRAEATGKEVSQRSIFSKVTL